LLFNNNLARKLTTLDFVAFAPQDDTPCLIAVQTVAKIDD
jgi:hypothetical protein